MEVTTASLPQEMWLLGFAGLCLFAVGAAVAAFARKRSAEAKEEAFAIMQNIFGGLDVMIHVTDPKTDELLFVNDVMRRHYNIEGNYAGRLCYAVFRDNITERCNFCPCDRLNAKLGEVVTWEDHNSKTNRFYRNTSRYINWINGKSAHLHQAIDITDMKYELMKYELTRDALGAGLWDMDILNKDPSNSDYLFVWSQQFRKMLGFTDESDFPNLLESWSDRLHPEDAERTLNALMTHLSDYSGKTPYDVEYRLMLKSGEYKHFRAYGTTLRDDDGAPLRTAGALEDIEEKKQLHDALERREKVLNALNETAVMLTSHKNETFDEVMSAGLRPVAEAMGIDRIAVYRRLGDETQLGQIFLWFRGRVLPLDEQLTKLPEVPPVLRWLEILRTGQCVNADVRDMRDDEAEFAGVFGIKAIIFVPIFVRDEFWGVITLEDHTTYRYFEEENLDLLRSAAHLCAVTVARAEMEREINDVNAKLKIALEEATAASRAKSDFLSQMSHEMRTPMNAITGMTAIGRNAPDAEQKDYALGKIEDASSHLLGVINDVLDMAKIEANKLELSPVEFNFDRMLQKVISVINFRVEEKRQHISVNTDRNIPRFIVGDDQRLAQVITNLLSNAVKFAPEGGDIRLDIALTGESDGICELRIEVSDNGIGISPEQQTRLFRAFEQAESGTSREYGGTGLGLAISKSIVEMMGGRIWVESEAGGGSRFIFTINARRGEKTPRSLLAPGVNWENARVLVADNLPETIDQFRDLFDILKINCDFASDGPEVCRFIEERGAYDIYFVEWRMPGMDGIELARRIKALGGARPSVVIMITASDWEAIKDEAYAAGVEKHMIKPLFSSMIIDCMNECLAVPRDSKEKKDIAMDIFKDRRLLLAEDIEINREILMTLLEDTGLLIDCAENGREALDMIAAAPDKYDIVFMDVQMSHMDGLEATRRIRALPERARGRLPIVAMTANVFKSDIDECIGAGMDDHIGKPIVIDNVLEVLRKYL